MVTKEDLATSEMELASLYEEFLEVERRYTAKKIAHERKVQEHQEKLEREDKEKQEELLKNYAWNSLLDEEGKLSVTTKGTKDGDIGGIKWDCTLTLLLCSNSQFLVEVSHKNGEADYMSDDGEVPDGSHRTTFLSVDELIELLDEKKINGDKDVPDSAFDKLREELVNLCWDYEQFVEKTVKKAQELP